MNKLSRREILERAIPIALALPAAHSESFSREAHVTALSGAGAGAKESGADEGVTAPEDLMREHGVIRRSFLIYDALAGRLERGESIPLKELRRTAELFRNFGEQYHEHSEEIGVFPVLKKAGKHVQMVEVLLEQHKRGRKLTDYLLAVAKSGSLSADQKHIVAQQLRHFSRMYANHAAREDTIIFPALREVLGPKGIDELGDRFEDEEKRILGEGGFEHGVSRVGEIEAALNLADLAQFTPPPPPQP
jgi:hemerythrin-like domain-containing protein